MCNKQFSHCEIWSHFTCSLYFHLPSACENTDANRELLVMFHADPCNESYPSNTLGALEHTHPIQLHRQSPYT